MTLQCLSIGGNPHRLARNGDQHGSYDSAPGAELIARASPPVTDHAAAMTAVWAIHEVPLGGQVSLAQTARVALSLNAIRTPRKGH